MRKNRSKMAWIFIAPALSVYLIFFIYPSTQAFFVSFFEWSGFSDEKKFVGIRNFIEISGDESFLMSLNHTLLILFVGGVLIFLIAFIFSIFFR